MSIRRRKDTTEETQPTNPTYAGLAFISNKIHEYEHGKAKRVAEVAKFVGRVLGDAELTNDEVKNRLPKSRPSMRERLWSYKEGHEDPEMEVLKIYKKQIHDYKDLVWHKELDGPLVFNHIEISDRSAAVQTETVKTVMQRIAVTASHQVKLTIISQNNDPAIPTEQYFMFDPNPTAS